MVASNTKKGMALIWAVVMCSLLMLIATIVAGTIIKESQMTVRIDDSTIAYSAAESGIAWGTKAIDDYVTGGGTGVPGASVYSFTINKAKTEVSFAYNATSEVYTIESTGTSGNTKRKIVQWYESKALTTVDLPNLPYAASPKANVFTGTKSFIFQFDFWEDSTLNTYDFGLQSSTGGYLKFRSAPSGLLQFVTKKSAAATEVVKTIVNPAAGDTPISVSQPYDIQISISYIKNTSASITISKRDATTGYVVDNCTRRVSVDLTNVDMGDFTSLVFSPTTLSRITNNNPVIGDNDVLRIGSSPTNVAYVDNIVQKGLTVVAATPAPACTLTPNPATITSGGSSTISWTTTNSTSLTINGVSRTPVASGSMSTGILNTTTTYTGNVTGPGGTGTCSTRVTVTPSSWIAGRGSLVGKSIYNIDTGNLNLAWKTSDTSCTSTECTIGLDGSFPSAYSLKNPQTNPGVNFSAYPAQNACKAIGGRLPTTGELGAILADTVYYGNNFAMNPYWTATQTSATGAYDYINFSPPFLATGGKTALFNVRCIK
ncbi:MAG: hypothetical protein WC437_02845 [Patescibacteria group bacterium]|jgi:hypothetical protein|nr:hypothetical protein [Patescibacteria group bacterium]